MYKHHEDTIKNITEKLKKRADILGLLIGGSIAHGFETAVSDVDIMLIVSDEDYRKRFKTGELHYWENESCTYKDGYIDGKYICLEFMQKVAKYGSEPARFAFDGSLIAFSNIEGLEELLARIARYPIDKKNENMKRFYAQLEAWKWYSSEAIRHQNEYLLNLSVSNIILFGGRLILAYNEVLYPYHKWFLKVLGKVPNKPDCFMGLIDNVLARKNEESIEMFYQNIKNLTDWGIPEGEWVYRFLSDSELNWLDGKIPVSDI